MPRCGDLLSLHYYLKEQGKKIYIIKKVEEMKSEGEEICFFVNTYNNFIVMCHINISE